MNPSSSRLDRLKSALDEVLAQRRVFSEAAYHELVHALNERIQALQIAPPDPARLPERDEIRLVSVMFVDVENSTRLAQRLDEEWKTLISELHHRLARVVDDWHGEIGQYLGDGVLCFFGAHRSRDDDATRAVSCALAIQQMASELASAVRERYGEDFALRIGISTGRVVVGTIGLATRREVAAFGSTPNLASRLQKLCEPRQVLIDAQTYHRVRDWFVTARQTPVSLKGFDTPVETYLVTGRRYARAAALTSETIAGIALPFVGREREFNYLLRLWDDALSEQAMHVVSLVGETGVGKSRLLQEALAIAADRPFYVITLVGRDEKRTAAFTLVNDLVAEICHRVDGSAAPLSEARILNCVQQTWPEAPREAAVVIGKLAGLAFADSPVSDLDPLETVAAWLSVVANRRALLIAIDNLQWVDHASLDLLEYLAIALVNSSGILLAAARPDFRDRRPRFMATCARYTEICIGRLSDDATRSLIEHVVRYVDNVPPRLVEHIRARSEGNPLFVEEFLSMLFDNGVFEARGNGRWRTNSFLYGTLADTLPSGLQGIFQARLDDLLPEMRRILQIAAVIGMTFWEGAVTQFSGVSTGPLLTKLVERGILARNPESTLPGQNEFRFRHTLYREVAYSMLMRPDREHYHRLTADWLTWQVADQPEFLTSLAEHLSHGQKHEQALAVYLAAAQDRMRRGMPDEVLKLVDIGLANTSDIPREVALPVVSQLWLQRGLALLTLRRYEQASADGQAARRLMRELPGHDLVEQREQAEWLVEEARVYMARAADNDVQASSNR